MRVLAFALASMWSCAAHASHLPEAQRTDDAKRWLAVAFIAEAGWADPKHSEGKADHRAIYHVLRRRWTAAVKRYPKLTFLRMVQNYVAAFDSRTEKVRRVRWLLSLQPGRSSPPAGWPPTANWDVHRVWWVQAQERAARCIDGGRCSDPYPTALHWGGAGIDIPKACMRKLPNVGTFNTFYDVDVQCVKQRRRAASTARRRHRKVGSHARRKDSTIRADTASSR